MVSTIVRYRVTAFLIMLTAIVLIITGSLRLSDLFGVSLLAAGSFLLIMGVMLLIKPSSTPRNMLGLLLLLFSFFTAAVTAGVYLNNQAVRAWGSNQFYELGIGEIYSAAYAPRTVMNPVPFDKVTATIDGLSYAIDRDGTVWAWGSNVSGALGNGTYYDSTVPVKVLSLKEVVQVAGYDFGIALDSKQEVWTWGNNSYGQLGNGTYDNNPVPAKVEGLNNIIAIAAKDRYCMALDSDGIVWTWGMNYFGQLGDGTRINRNRPLQVAGLPLIKAVGSGSSTSYALDRQGRVWAWGNNYYGAFGDGTYTNSYVPVLSLAKDIISITAGSGICYATDQDNVIWGWGYNATGGLGDGTTVTRNSPVIMDTLQDMKEISIGSHNLALDEKGRVWVWGANYLGSLGNGQDGIIHYITPTLFKDVSNVTELSAGTHNLVIEELPIPPMIVAIIIAVILFITGILLWFI